MIEEKHIHSAIIGFWRQGADIDSIASTVKLTAYYVTNVIYMYFKTPELW